MNCFICYSAFSAQVCQICLFFVLQMSGLALFSVQYLNLFIWIHRYQHYCFHLYLTAFVKTVLRYLTFFSALSFIFQFFAVSYQAVSFRHFAFVIYYYYSFYCQVMAISCFFDYYYYLRQICFIEIIVATISNLHFLKSSLLYFPTLPWWLIIQMQLIFIIFRGFNLLTISFLVNYSAKPHPEVNPARR